MVSVESAGITDIGRIRKTNEDRIFIDDKTGLYLVADGMGGHQAGEVASSLVVETLRAHYGGGGGAGSPEEADDHLSRDAGRLLQGIHCCNRVVHETAKGRADYRGMGSTVAAVFFSQDTLVAANVGDSPIFLVRGGRIEQLAVMHTWLPECAGAACSPCATNVLTRAIGPKATVEADLCELRCYRNDVLVICSDGLSTKVGAAEIQSIAGNRPPHYACRTLVDLANERGGEDNISAVVVRVTRVRTQNSFFAGRWVDRFKKRLAFGG
jgi:protein phosphatase